MLITFLAKHEINVNPDQLQFFLLNLNKIVKLIIKLEIHCDLFNSNKLLLNGIGMKFNFTRNEDDF